MKVTLNYDATVEMPDFTSPSGKTQVEEHHSIEICVRPGEFYMVYLLNGVEALRLNWQGLLSIEKRRSEERIYNTDSS